MNTAENTAVAFAEKMYAHMITKMANVALENCERLKRANFDLKFELVAFETDGKDTSLIESQMRKNAEEYTFESGRVNAFKSVLAELESN